MRERFAAQSVIEVLLLEQSLVPPRSPLARFFGRSPLGPESMFWYRGAKAEMAVGMLLAELPAEWTTFHAIPAGAEGTEIDHLVVGPGGVFTIQTKRHRGKRVRVAGRTVVVDGERLPYIRKAELDAARVTTLLRERMLLRPSVRPVVAIVGAKRITMYQKPAQVKVLDAEDLRPWLLTRPPVLDPVDRIEAANIIDSPDTWDAFPSLEPQQLISEFAALEKSVRAARKQRIFWVPFGSAALIVGAAGMPYLITALIGLSVAH
ncbi:nuclease-related domain-containing protein [Cryobacterium sp. MLB-32]|uniref:nuclease-related domain-containing protein n=1 Tax=Cryobacterium sp. MLB-32 TaxID=1529318 RepID=UPI00068E52A3|nr:nuclease-related domain-containing protein [Cryobacterium sp. MLB-32]